MPSHTAASGLIKLYEINGAPWNWPAWQERTGITHGLFPEDDKQLPPGWTRQDAIDVKAYFDAYIQLKTEDQKIRFATKTKGSGSNFPGRLVWNSFVSRYWNQWGIHNLIVEELREGDIHPMAIIGRELELKGRWPHADNYVSTVLDSLGMRLFGEEAFPPNCTVVPTMLRKALQVFAQRSWNTIRGQIKGMKKNRNEIEATAKAAFVELETGKPTKAKVARTIRAVAKWKDTAELFGLPADLKNAEDMLSELATIMAGLGVKIQKNPKIKPKGSCKVSLQALKNLATEEDVSELRHVYHEYFVAHVEDEDAQPLSGPSVEDRSLNNSTGDLGMEVENTMSLSALQKALGFRTGLPMQFNKYRHRGGVTPWDDEKIFQADPPPEELEPLQLHWHQLAGVHSIVRSLFTQERDIEHTLGVLIGDEVGLGKTAQAITTIGFLNQLIYHKAHEKQLPPVLDDRPWLAGSKKVPSLPHLIVCPGTLVAQWVHELKVLLLPHSVDIFVYDSQTDSKTFWGPDGPIQKSRQERHNQIIVASHSVIFNDFKKLHSVAAKKKKGSNPWDIPALKPSQTLKDTIFNQFFLSVIIDEAHHMRNLGNKQTSTLRLLQQAKVSLIMTATPIHTAPKDIISMGRLVGLPYFFSELCIAEEKDDNALIRKAKKLDDDGEALRAVRVQITRRLHDRCKGHFLRRTTGSRDWVGRTLLPLPPYLEIIGLLRLSDREVLILQDRQEAAKAALLTASTSTRILTKKFYLEYRTGVAFAQEDPAAPYPIFKSLEEWASKMSTKMDTCARACVHYLTHDDVPDITFEDGELVLPKVEVQPGQKVTRARRIIIYSEFSSMASLFQNVLGLYGVPSLTINGQMTFQQRDQCIKKFHDPKNEERVLIFSSVGSAGLNLAIADVVIFFDQPWSAQDEQQIRGRAHRQPQKKTVKVIYLLAMESADLLLHGVARGKQDMFNAFMNNQLAEELQTLLQGHALDVPPLIDDDPLDTPGAGPSTLPNEGGARRPRRQLVVDDDPVDTPGAGSSTLPDEGGGMSDAAPMSVGDDLETRSVNMSDAEAADMQRAIELSLVNTRSDARSDHSGMDVDPESAPESSYSIMSGIQGPSNANPDSGNDDKSPPPKRAKKGKETRMVAYSSSDESNNDEAIEHRESQVTRNHAHSESAATNANENVGHGERPPNSIAVQKPKGKRPERSTSGSSTSAQGPESKPDEPRKGPSKSPREFLVKPSHDTASNSSSRRTRVQESLISSHELVPDEEREQPPPSRPSRTPGSLQAVAMPSKVFLKAMHPRKDRI
ncbi:hypothetical protein NP233_g8897 [Leucocoprinus birnbaumii]|uniref:Uncharacterized protein n=1 Tax=Leucocoprinus birnbaumii TaxID=56174 RepID=A0AAD5VLL6_9AGAR|nr:hypothetical protein NP233_g8897 [Leucocoprinus birnbaumii]